MICVCLFFYAQKILSSWPQRSIVSQLSLWNWLDAFNAKYFEGFNFKNRFLDFFIPSEPFLTGLPAGVPKIHTLNLKSNSINFHIIKIEKENRSKYVFGHKNELNSTTEQKLLNGKLAQLAQSWHIWSKFNCILCLHGPI